MPSSFPLRKDRRKPLFTFFPLSPLNTHDLPQLTIKGVNLTYLKRGLTDGGDYWKTITTATATRAGWCGCVVAGRGIVGSFTLSVTMMYSHDVAVSCEGEEGGKGRRGKGRNQWSLEWPHLCLALLRWRNLHTLSNAHFNSIIITSKHENQINSYISLNYYIGIRN